MNGKLTVRSSELRHLLRIALEAAEAIIQDLERSISNCRLKIQHAEAGTPYADELNYEVFETLRNLKEEMLFCHTQHESRKEQIALIKGVLARPDINTARVWRIDFAFMGALMKLRDIHIHMANEGQNEERRARREFAKLHTANSDDEPAATGFPAVARQRRA